MRIALTTAATIVACVGAADAGPREAAQRMLGSPSGDGLVRSATLVTARDGGTATLSFTVAAGITEAEQVTVPLKLPAGARAIAMTATLGRDKLITSELGADVATVRFNDRVRFGAHLALLESDGDQLRLRVNVSRTRAARVVVSLALPHDERTDWMTADPAGRGQVSAMRSFLALAPPSGAIPTVTIGQPTSSCGSEPVVDGRMIRRFIRRQLPRLAACYQRALQRDHMLAGTVVLHFTVPPNGRVENLSVDGPLDSQSVRECLLDDLAQWVLPAMPASAPHVRVSYPLHFVRP